MVTIRESVRGVKEGVRFGCRVALGSPFSAGRYGKVKDIRRWRVVVRCDCGRVDASDIGGFIGSESCRSCATRAVNTTHGGCAFGINGRNYDPIYTIWSGIRNRCNCKTANGYKYYGGRGIRISPAWDTFEAFRDWANSNGYKPGLDLDRIDNDGNYEPSNCQWITGSENVRKMWTDKKAKREYAAIWAKPEMISSC